MRTNIGIDDALLEAAMRADPYQKNRRDAVEAGLKLLAGRAYDCALLRSERDFDAFEGLRGPRAWRH